MIGSPWSCPFVRERATDPGVYAGYIHLLWSTDPVQHDALRGCQFIFRYTSTFAASRNLSAIHCDLIITGGSRPKPPQRAGCKHRRIYSTKILQRACLRSSCCPCIPNHGASYFPIPLGSSNPPGINILLCWHFQRNGVVLNVKLQQSSYLASSLYSASEALPIVVRPSRPFH
ncbi:hypothetical protein BKA67DRAFT_104256 [Truncatella angustata]|uniref:Uncharacterized protein n=1 Tax=Truncatella angustata TaxID=152316 RepID=A0A9P8UBS1_9PEZI|nr:uncharacterized protein BKA67DRAFT_104256 [Truncatella angustata]KAH6646457.1 hypothetical protein BKA67DRAFT_104256 [Truncatella angustata]